MNTSESHPVEITHCHVRRARGLREIESHSESGHLIGRNDRRGWGGTKVVPCGVPEERRHLLGTRVGGID